MVSKKYTHISIAILLSSIALTVCLPFGNKRIFKHDSGDHSKFPYLASLGIRSGQGFRHYCGASIVSKKFVLTAADCFPQFDPITDIRVFVSHNHRYDDGQSLQVKRFIKHPKYNGSLINNIALVEVDSPIEFSMNVTSIELERTRIDGGELVFVAGYGYSAPGAPDHLGEVQYTNLDALTNDACAGRLGDQHSNYKDNINRGTLCTTTKDYSALMLADEGDPLVYHSRLIGVAAWYVDGPYPDGYMRISEYANWIVLTISESANE